jgi:hypothetical protein
MDNELKDIQAIGTDGDEALMNAVFFCNLLAVHQPCPSKL